MLSPSQRIAIRELRRQGMGARQIARTLGISPRVVSRVIRSGSTEPAAILGSQGTQRFREKMVEPCADCRGNLVQVHEELLTGNAARA